MESDGHAALMFGYQDESYNKFFVLKDSEMENERPIPFRHPTIEEVRTNLQNKIYPQIDPNDFVLAHKGYVVKFVSV